MRGLANKAITTKNSSKNYSYRDPAVLVDSKPTENTVVNALGYIRNYDLSPKIQLLILFMDEWYSNIGVPLCDMISDPRRIINANGHLMFQKELIQIVQDFSPNVKAEDASTIDKILYMSYSAIVAIMHIVDCKHATTQTEKLKKNQMTPVEYAQAVFQWESDNTEKVLVTITTIQEGLEELKKLIASFNVMFSIMDGLPEKCLLNLGGLFSKMFVHMEEKEEDNLYEDAYKECTIMLKDMQTRIEKIPNFTQTEMIKHLQKALSECYEPKSVIEYKVADDAEWQCSEPFSLCTPSPTRDPKWTKARFKHNYDNFIIEYKKYQERQLQSQLQGMLMKRQRMESSLESNDSELQGMLMKRQRMESSLESSDSDSRIDVD